MPAPCGGEIGHSGVSMQVVSDQASRGTQDPPGEPGGSRDFGRSEGSLVEADVHPHVAPAVRCHRRLPHVALVIGVVVRLVDVRQAEVDDRSAEAMVPPMLGATFDVTLDMALNRADAAVVEVNLRLATVAVVNLAPGALEVHLRLATRPDMRRTLEVAH